MKPKCFDCDTLTTRGAGMNRTDGGEDFSTICEVTGRPTDPSADACADFTPAAAKKETPRTAKDGASVDIRKYIKSRDELHRMTLAELGEHITNCINAYARFIAHKAIDLIGRG